MDVLQCIIFYNVLLDIDKLLKIMINVQLYK